MCVSVRVRVHERKPFDDAVEPHTVAAYTPPIGCRQSLFGWRARVSRWVTTAPVRPPANQNTQVETIVSCFCEIPFFALSRSHFLIYRSVASKKKPLIHFDGFHITQQSRNQSFLIMFLSNDEYRDGSHEAQFNFVTVCMYLSCICFPYNFLHFLLNTLKTTPVMVLKMSKSKQLKMSNKIIS